MTQQQAKKENEDTVPTPMSDNDYVYVAIMPYSWGKGEYAAVDAVKNACRNFPYDRTDNDTVTCSVFKVHKDFEIDGYSGAVRSEELEKDEDFDLPVDGIERVAKMFGETELLTEQMMCDGEINGEYLSFAKTRHYDR